ncbi:MAG: hypothetical protein ACYTAF_12205 [Planctomycetota bacterium]|jgi:hypothetical protein
MRKAIVPVAVLLGISVLINVLTLIRLNEHRSAPPAGARDSELRDADPVRAVEPPPPPDDGDLSDVLRELYQLRRDVAALRKDVQKGPRPTGVAEGSGEKSDPEPPSSFDSDPDVAELLAEKDALQSLWEDLRKLRGLGKAISEEKYREAVLKATIDHLGFDRRTAEQFTNAALGAMTQADAARRNRDDALKALQYDRANPEVYRKKHLETQQRYQQDMKTALAQIEAFLGGGLRHTQFQANMQTWFHYLLPMYGPQGGPKPR